MSKCIGITDSYLTPIIESCKQLETLNIAECPDLSDASLDLLPSYLRSSLVSLNISGCLGFTPEVYFSLFFLILIIMYLLIIIIIIGLGNNITSTHSPDRPSHCTPQPFRFFLHQPHFFSQKYKTS